MSGASTVTSCQCFLHFHGRAQGSEGVYVGARKCTEAECGSGRVDCGGGGRVAGSNKMPTPELIPHENPSTAPHSHVKAVVLVLNRPLPLLFVQAASTGKVASLLLDISIARVRGTVGEGDERRLMGL